MPSRRQDDSGRPAVNRKRRGCVRPTGEAKNAHANALNGNKNRTDMPGEKIKFPSAGTISRASLQIAWMNFRAHPVTVVGFLSQQNQRGEPRESESTNCHLTGDDELA